ncbi:MAG: hypothetical protein ABI488_01320 [Polyangiaceae bacterium]
MAELLLHALNNIDKHRMLVTVGSSFTMVDVGPSMSAMFKATGWPPTRPGLPPIEFPAFTIPLRPLDKMCPLKIGDVLFIDRPDAEPAPGTMFGFDVALSHKGIVEDEPVVLTLASMVKAARDAVDALRVFL